MLVACICHRRLAVLDALGFGVLRFWASERRVVFLFPML